MIKQTPLFRVTTGNLFGITSGWVETFHRRALEIVAECDDDVEEGEYCYNPAFAGAWVTVFKKETANKIERCWKKLLPLALRTMAPRWRQDYDKSIGKLQC